MKVILAIVLVCGVASCQEYERAIQLAHPVAARHGDPRRNGPVFTTRGDVDLHVARPGAVDVRRDVDVHDVFDDDDDLEHDNDNRKDDYSHKMDVYLRRNFNSPSRVGYLGKRDDFIFGYNERLIKVVRSVLANLVYSVNDESNTAKRRFTKFSYFFYRYLEAKNGHFQSDFREALEKYLKVEHKPSYVLAGPVRAVFSKFVAAVSRRVAVVQEECMNTVSFVCKPQLDRRDREASAKCLLYYQNVRLHEAALANVDSAEHVLEFGLAIAEDLESSQPEGVLRRLETPEYVKHFQNVKAVYGVLQRYQFKCSYQDDNQNDDVSQKFF